jgi:methionine-rich copper-binding protein CopC
VSARAQARRAGQLWLLGWFWLLWPLAAAAHAHLKQSQPAEGAVIAAPAQFTLSFSESAQLTALSLKKAGQSPAQELGPLPAAAGERLSVPAPRLDPGSYELRYRVISADGHIMAGSVHFTVTAP